MKLGEKLKFEASRNNNGYEDKIIWTWSKLAYVPDINHIQMNLSRITSWKPWMAVWVYETPNTLLKMSRNKVKDQLITAWLC